MQRAAEIENWTNQIYRPAPSRYRPSIALPAEAVRPEAAGSSSPILASGAQTQRGLRVPGAPYHRAQTGLAYGVRGLLSPLVDLRSSDKPPKHGGSQQLDYTHSQLHNVIQQPPPDFEPFNFPLLASALLRRTLNHFEGLRTTPDSLATTDYPPPVALSFTHCPNISSLCSFNCSQKSLPNVVQYKCVILIASVNCFHERSWEIP
jgi:chitin synthase